MKTIGFRNSFWGSYKFGFWHLLATKIIYDHELKWKQLVSETHSGGHIYIYICIRFLVLLGHENKLRPRNWMETIGFRNSSWGSYKFGFWYFLATTDQPIIRYEVVVMMKVGLLERELDCGVITYIYTEELFSWPVQCDPNGRAGWQGQRLRNGSQAPDPGPLRRNVVRPHAVAGWPPGACALAREPPAWGIVRSPLRQAMALCCVAVWPQPWCKHIYIYIC